jgi:hypothetical protein
MMLRNVAANIGLLLGACIVSAVVLEVAIRVMLPVYSPVGKIHFECVDGRYLAPKDSQLRQWTNTGDFDVSIVTNSQGFRDTKDLRDATENDLVVIGDSFSFGHGVEVDQRYSDRLQLALGRPIYNVSIPTNLDGYLLTARYANEVSEGLGTVIVGVCMENDLTNYGETPQQCTPRTDLTKPGTWITHPSKVTFMDVKLLFTAHSAAYSAFTSVVHQSPTLKAIGLRLGIMEPPLFTGDKDYEESKILASASRLAQIANEFEIIALIIPSRALWQGDNQDAESTTHAAFVAELARRDIQTLDLRPVFERGGHPLDYHFQHDSHWNSEGHRIAAEALVGVINAQ